MLVKKVKYLVISDIHLGHKHNKTEDVVKALVSYFKKNHNLFKNLDIIFIAGDIFDKLLSNFSPEYIMIVEWISTLAVYCKHNNIKLRILEGTPSHDWKQFQAIAKTIPVFETDLDFKYIPQLDIEYMPDLGINVLYIPDEWKNNKADVTYNDVMDLMKEKGLEQVDVAIMHGQFKHQLPVELDSSHDEQKYLDLVKYYISIGHIHTSSVFERILAQGSFGRDRHGEEEDKGGMVMTLYKSGEMEFRFIKNELAKTFITYDARNQEVDEIVKEYDSKINKLKIDSFVRFFVASESNIKKIEKPLKEKYPLYNIKVETKEKKKLTIAEAIQSTEKIEGFEITEENITSMLLDRVDEKYELDSNIRIDMRNELENIVSTV